MKYLKLYENFIQSDSEIHELCKKYNIIHYTINNGLVDVDGNVDLSTKKLTKIPIKFGNVNGYFHCDGNQLTSLEGGPQKVGGDFYCSRNRLTSLEGAPKYIGGNFYCSNNGLTSLNGLEETVCNQIYCLNNKIFRLDFIPNYKNGFYIKDNPFFNVWILIKDSIKKDYTLFDHFIENNIFRDPGYQGDDSGLPIIIIDRLNDFLDMCKLPNVEEVDRYTCI